MDSNTFHLLRDDAEKALKEERLLDALSAIGGLLSGGSWQLQNELNELKASYGMLLNYMARGTDDPGRNRLWSRFVRQAGELATSAYREYELRESTSPYASIRRTLEKLSSPTSLTGIAQQGGCSYRHLFDCVWTSGKWSEEEAAAAQELLEDSHRADFDKCLLLSATMLAAITYFDEAKLRLLLNHTVSPSMPLRCRALTGCALVCICHKERLHHYPQLQMQISLLADDPKFREELLALQFQLLMSLETKQIEKSLREDIMPTVIKNAKKFKADPANLEKMAEEFNEMNLNPEWMKADAETSQLTKKMQELAEMQQRGADVYMSTFTVMKQKFPFFSVVANWFCPFTLDHPDLKSIGASGTNWLNPLLSAGQFCNSDKYSFYLMLTAMPGMQSDMLRSQFGEMMGDTRFAEAANEEELKDIRQHIRLYVQDLYRYFKLFSPSNRRIDPFQQDLLLCEHSVFKGIFSANQLAEMAAFAFREKLYGHALHLFEQLPKEYWTAEIFQKAGYCHQQEHNYQSAAEAYEHANLLNGNSQWTLKQLANCHYALGDFPTALAAYCHLETLTPEDTRLLLRIAECRICEKQYEKALTTLYKADYLAPDHPPTMRAIAWCSLLVGKLEQAQRYYDKLLAQSPTPADCLNAGHAAWLRSDLPTAVTLYRRSLKAQKMDFAPTDFFDSDREILLQGGISAADLLLMRDLLNNQ